MNEYLTLLNDKIKSLPKDYRNEILNDYKSHFEEGHLLGRSEESIIKELGDVDYIAKNIIDEYYAENVHEVNNSSEFSKATEVLINLGFGALNILIAFPIVVAILTMFLAMYLLAFTFLISPVFLVINLVAPNIPISFGTDIFILKIILVAIMFVGGYYLLKYLNKINKKVFRGIYIYIIKSLKFKFFNINKYN